MKAGLKVGANLAGMQQNLILSLSYHVSTRLGTRDAYIPMMPGHPAFGFRGSCGISVGAAGFEELIAVNQVGKRFFNEVRLIARTGGNRYPGNGITPNRGIDHKPHDWRNCTHEWLRTTYDYDHGIEAAPERAAAGKPIRIGQIGAACVCGYLDFRFADENWRSRAALAAWYESVRQRASVVGTVPV